MEKLNSCDGIVRVVSIASGPAEEILNIYKALGKEERGRLKVVGIDIDKRACASVDDQIFHERLQNHFSTCAESILKLSSPPPQLQDQDLVYSMGLVDYFKDRATQKIISTMFAMLKPGGEAIIGNFHERCDSRIFLDYLLDWKLIYRTEEDMKRLFSNSSFKSAKVTVDYEEEGVNMLARCQK